MGSYGVTGGETITISGDTLSSLKIPAGYKVTLYEHPNFQGWSKTFTSDATSVGDFNDITSSLKSKDYSIHKNGTTSSPSILAKF